MKKKILVICLVAIAVIAIFIFNQASFNSKTIEDMRQEILNERNIAIAKAVEKGIYRCCIEPPCTMCFMEANEWNHFKAGECHCDNLIAEGEEPCPQCKRVCDSKCAPEHEH